MIKTDKKKKRDNAKYRQIHKNFNIYFIIGILCIWQKSLKNFMKMPCYMFELLSSWQDGVFTQG